MQRYVTPVPIRDSYFGKYYDLSNAFEGKVESVVVATDNYGLNPVRIMLPHQLYLETAEKLIDAYGSKGGIWVLPIRDKWLRVV